MNNHSESPSSLKILETEITMKNPRVIPSTLKHPLNAVHAFHAPRRTHQNQFHHVNFPRNHTSHRSINAPIPTSVEPRSPASSLCFPRKKAFHFQPMTSRTRTRKPSKNQKGNGALVPRQAFSKSLPSNIKASNILLLAPCRATFGSPAIRVGKDCAMRVDETRDRPVCTCVYTFARVSH